MAQRLDAGMGSSEASPRASDAAARTSQNQVVRLGRLEEALPEVPQSQTFASRRVPEEDRQEAKRIDSARSFHHRNHRFKYELRLTVEVTKFPKTIFCFCRSTNEAS